MESPARTAERLLVVGLAVLAAGLSGCAHLGLQAALTASPTHGSLPLTVEFRVSQSSFGTSDGRFLLDFGDGTGMAEGTDLDVAIRHTYEQEGRFRARLIVIGRSGRTDQTDLAIRPGDVGPVEGFSIGDLAYNFEARTTDGRDVSLRSLRGRVVLIEFWGSWCRPCKQSMPHINALWEAHHDEGLDVLAVSTDENPEDPIRFLQENGFEGLTCIWEPGGKKTRIKQLYGVDWIPRSIVVDRAGTVRFNEHPTKLEGGFIEQLLVEHGRSDGAS